MTTQQTLHWIIVSFHSTLIRMLILACDISRSRTEKAFQSTLPNSAIYSIYSIKIKFGDMRQIYEFRRILFIEWPSCIFLNDK